MTFADGKSEGAKGDEFFRAFIGSLSPPLREWDYFVNWEKVRKSAEVFRAELHLLDSLVGAENFDVAARELIGKYPGVVQAFPVLLAIREKRVGIAGDSPISYDFSRPARENEIVDAVAFLRRSGIAAILERREIRGVYSYAVGVEVGLDTHGRKNRGGKAMEKIVQTHLESACELAGAQFIPEATPTKIREEWGITVKMDKASRRVDFAVNKGGKLVFIETNFYSDGGSKLKSTAGEYEQMFRFWADQGIQFLWITDGEGWKKTQGPLRDYYDRCGALMNLAMLSRGDLGKFLRAV